MKILITGSSGYVGYILAKFFSEKKISCTGIDISPNSTRTGNKYFNFHTCDITDKKMLTKIFEKEKPTHVIHLAYLMEPLHNKKREHEIDVKGSEYILQISNNIKSVQQLILFSSTSAYGAWKDHPLRIGENTPLRPRGYRYGINKKIVEEYYKKYQNRNDLHLVIVRMCTAIGPLYHKKGGVVALLTHAPLLIKFNGNDTKIQFLHENDLTALTHHIVHDSQITGTYNLVPDSFAKISELSPQKPSIWFPLKVFQFIIQILRYLRISSIRSPAIALSCYSVIASANKLKKKYKYKFKYSTLEGFRQTVKERKNKGTL